MFLASIPSSAYKVGSPAAFASKTRCLRNTGMTLALYSTVAIAVVLLVARVATLARNKNTAASDAATAGRHAARVPFRVDLVAVASACATVAPRESSAMVRLVCYQSDAARRRRARAVVADAPAALSGVVTCANHAEPHGTDPATTALEAGLILVAEVVGADAIALLVTDGHGQLQVAADRMWAAGRLALSDDLWRRALAGATGPLLAPPVLGFPVELGGRMSGMLCVELPSRLDGPPARVADLNLLAHLLVDVALNGPRRRTPVGIEAIHKAADPAGAFMRKLATAHGNVSQMARDVGCTRKAIYAAAERYGVRLPRRGGRR